LTLQMLNVTFQLAMPLTLLLGRTAIAELLTADACLAAVESALKPQGYAWHEVTRCISNKPKEVE
jgi:hypothetical protein